MANGQPFPIREHTYVEFLLDKLSRSSNGDIYLVDEDLSFLYDLVSWYSCEIENG